MTFNTLVLVSLRKEASKWALWFSAGKKDLTGDESLREHHVEAVIFRRIE